MSFKAHDALFRSAFGDPKNAADELRCVLSEAIVRHIDFDSLEQAPGAFIDDKLKEFQSDLLYRANIGGREGYVYLALEHQSTAPRDMSFRLLRYMVHVWQMHREQQPKAPYYPLVIPVVIHHSAAGWTAPRRFSELLDPLVKEVPELAAMTPDFEFALDDISHKTDAELQARAMGYFPQLALWALRDSRNGEHLLLHMTAWKRAFGEVSAAPNGREALGLIFRYIALVADDLSFDRIIAEARKIDPITEETAMTIAETLRAEGEAKGRAEGEAKGRAVGEASAKRSMLGKLLRLKFGDLSATATARLEAATDEELELWTERVLTASSLDELFV